MTQLRIKADDIEKEITLINGFNDDEYIKIIHDAGFECDFCGKCCTSEFNDHVFLLNEDTERISINLGKEYLRPAPYFDFCDNFGRFYVMGYALKTGQNGDCIFYTCGRCRYYEIRPCICRIYPYMLHREPDDNGNTGFRQIGGLNKHGYYNSEISEETCREILKSVKGYETGFLRQELLFIKEIETYFKKNNLKNTRQMYDRMMRKYEKGEEIEVYVFFKGNFAKEKISKQIINHE